MSEGQRFSIGDYAWLADWTSCEDYVVCPDCGGSRRLRVTFHDETQVSIACQNCALGYDLPTGRVRVYTRTARVRREHVNGVEIGPSGTRWRLGLSDTCYRTVDDADLFTEEADALARAAERCAELDAQDRQKVFAKEKDTRTWAWNASYHRKQIKYAEGQIAYHTSKLAVAALKAKETAPA